jgi:hypothetical protein
MGLGLMAGDIAAGSSGTPNIRRYEAAYGRSSQETGSKSRTRSARNSARRRTGEARMLSHRFGRYIPMTIVLLAAMVGLRSAAVGQDNFSLKGSPGSGVPEVIFYHGMVLDKNQREIPPTLDNVSFVLRRFTEALASRSSTAANARLVDILRTAPAPEMDKTDELLRSIAMARWMLADKDFSRKESLDPMLRALERWATIPMQEGINVQLRNNSRLAPALAAMQLDIQDEGTKKDQSPLEPTEYMKECGAAQVPVPPDWGDPRWIFHDTLDPDFSFVKDSKKSIAEIWTFTDPDKPGLCVGLPRILNETGGIDLFGIICQSKTTGKACFWDNVDRWTHEQLSSEESKRMKIAAIEDGSMLGENCTNCHRGENVFVIHPGTELDVLRELGSDTDVAWYSPISAQNNWGNPGPRTDLRSCKGCHALPELAANNNTLKPPPEEKSPYCRILKQVVTKTMPPGGAPAGWEKPQSHRDDVNLLKAKCKELGLE